MDREQDGHGQNANMIPSGSSKAVVRATKAKKPNASKAAAPTFRISKIRVDELKQVAYMIVVMETQGP
jgi:hypothetical protein